MRGRIFTVEEVAQVLGITPHSVRRRIRLGKLGAFQRDQGQRHFIPESEVARLIGMPVEETIGARLTKIEEDLNLIKEDLIHEVRSTQRLCLFILGELRFRRKQDGIK